MKDETKVELFDELLAGAARSSQAVDAILMALAPDPLHATQVLLLKESLDSTKVMLSKVSINPFFNTRFHLLLIVMERREKKSSPELRRKRCDRFILVLIAVQSTSLPLSTIFLKRCLRRP
jgi:hypothetical protein